MSSRLGYRPDPFDPRDLTFEDHLAGELSVDPAHPLGLAEPPDKSEWLNKFVLKVLEQQGESCVGYSIGQGYRVCLARDTGISPPPPEPSYGFVWWNSRNQHGEAKLNVGTYIRTALDVVSKLGVCTESHWPSDHLAWEFDKKPSHRAYRAAADQRAAITRAYFRLAGWGDELRRQVSLEINAGNPVVFGTNVLRSFLNIGQHGPLPPPSDWSQIAGGHAMVATSYDQAGVYGPNSWGPYWGNGGWFALSWEYILSTHTRDLWAIRTPVPFSMP